MKAKKSVRRVISISYVGQKRGKLERQLVLVLLALKILLIFFQFVVLLRA